MSSKAFRFIAVFLFEIMGTLVKKQKPFGTAPNDLLNDDRISFKAKGLFCFIDSKPDGWNFSEKRISEQTKDGLFSVRSAIKELIEFGYLLREEFRNDKGNKKVNYILYWNPIDFEETEETEQTEKPIKKKKKKKKKKETKSQEQIKHPFSEKFNDYWSEWKFFRKKHDRFKYVNLDSEQRAFKKLHKLSGGNEKKAIKIIHQSIDNGWKGFFNLNDKNNERKKEVTGYNRSDAIKKAQTLFGKNK